jgi:hypothetical protein
MGEKGLLDRSSIKPTCRYGHGDLAMVTEKGNVLRWGYVGMHESWIAFAGNLFVCRSCGYTELFDDDIAATLANETAK